jgi:hypothetical protein
MIPQIPGRSLGYLVRSPVASHLHHVAGIDLTGEQHRVRCIPRVFGYQIEKVTSVLVQADW